MEPNAFVAEIQNDRRVLLAEAEYGPLLPSDKTSTILDIGFGGGGSLLLA
jgi:hypothetical protein